MTRNDTPAPATTISVPSTPESDHDLPVIQPSALQTDECATAVGPKDSSGTVRLGRSGVDRSR
jgi:hypothetical protein